MELRQFFAHQLEMAENYKLELKRKLWKAHKSEAEADSRLFEVKVRYGRKSLAFQVPMTERLRFVGFVHRNGCPMEVADRGQDHRSIGNESRPPERFLRSPLVKALALACYKQSETLRQALELYGGFWWYHLVWGTSEERPVSLTDMPSDVGKLEALTPGIASKIRLAGISPFLRRGLSSYQTRRSLSEGTLLKDLAFARHQAIFAALLHQITSLREQCDHPNVVDCIICGREGRSDLRTVAEYALHPRTCEWCSALITAKDKPANFYKGIDDNDQRKTFEKAFSKLDELTDFTYWRSPFLGRKTIKELRIGFLPDLLAIELSLVVGSLARPEVVGRLYENPEAIILGAGLANYFPRGRGRGVRTIAGDGHLCLSYGERDICEFLHKQGIEHSREPLYADFCGEPEKFGASRGDFLIGKTIFEFAGLAGDKVYDAKLKKKVSNARAQGVDVRVIGTKDLDNLFSIFEGFKANEKPI